MYPISRGTLINFAAFRSRYDLENSTLDGAWVQDVRREELLQDFDRWEPEVQALLDVSFSRSRPIRASLLTSIPCDPDSPILPGLIFLHH